MIEVMDNTIEQKKRNVVKWISIKPLLFFLIPDAPIFLNVILPSWPCAISSNLPSMQCFYKDSIKDKSHLQPRHVHRHVLKVSVSSSGRKA